MQSRRRIYSRNFERTSSSPTNGFEATKTPKNDRTLPYKLLRFPASKSALWDHNSIGNEETLQFIKGVPNLVISKDILRVGHRLINSDGEDAFGVSNGIITYDKQLQQLTLRIGRNLITSFSEETFSNTKLQFSRDSGSQRKPQNGDMIFSEATRKLLGSARTKETISIGRFFYMKMHCIYEERTRSTAKCDLWTDVVMFGTTFNVHPVEPLSIIPTALSKGLSDPNGNTFLHGEPKTGYLTMDELRRILLVLDTDPKVSSLPLVGIWISGIESIHNPFVWAACLRYVNCNALKEIICRPPEPFLIAFYNKPTFRPYFYDCIYRNIDRSSEFVFHSGTISSTIDFTNTTKDDDLEVFLQRTLKEPSELEISNVVQTPCQKLLFTSEATLERPNSGSLKLLKVHTGTSPSFDVLQRQSSEVYSENKKCSSPYVVASNSGEKNSGGFQCNDNRSLPIPPEIYQLLEAQEKQLKLLKQQVDELVRERSQSASSSSPIGTESASCSQGAKSTKALSSTATMTSFVWPPPQVPSSLLPAPSSGCSKCSKSESKTNESPQRDEPSFQSRTRCDSNVERSVEVVRRQQHLDSRLSLSKIEDSLGNLQFATFSEPPDSPKSTFFVDLHDYQESFASSENPSLPRPVPIESGNDVQFYPSDHNSNNFYDNLLRRIHTVLSQQSPANQRNDYRSPNINKSVFDSLFLPRLNYISLQFSTIDTDQSSEFGALACKYLTTRNTTSSSPSETELSIATMEYLKKYRL